MRTVIAIVAGIVLLLFALGVTAPATLLDGRIDAASGGRLHLADATGTLWNGAGALCLPSANARVDIGWRIDALPLLWGELRGSLGGGDDVSPKASFAIAHGSLTLREVAVRVPADAVLLALGAPAAMVGAGGVVGVSSAAFRKSGDSLTGGVALRWDNATVSAPGTALRVGLGDLRFDGTGQGRWLSGALANAGGEVEITGTAAVSADGALRVNAAVRPRVGIDERRAAAIATALGSVGRADGAGSYAVVLP